MGKFRLAILLGVVLTSVLPSTCCLAQPTPDASVLLTQLRDASQGQDAYAYAALFAGNSKWDGPFGQNAFGPLNIRAALGQFFTEFGPLYVVTTETFQLSSDVVMADVYQRTRGRHASLDPKLIAPGSGVPQNEADLRTTFILRKQESGWKILAARVADLRAGNSR
jgi:ketosteroid isomerase-like protein